MWVKRSINQPWQSTRVKVCLLFNERNGKKCFPKETIIWVCVDELNNHPSWYLIMNFGLIRPVYLCWLLYIGNKSWVFLWYTQLEWTRWINSMSIIWFAEPVALQALKNLGKYIYVFVESLSLYTILVAAKTKASNCYPICDLICFMTFLFLNWVMLI